MTTLLFASHTPEVSVFRVGSHHLCGELARMGHCAGHLATPLSPAKVLPVGDRTALRERWRACLRGPVRSSVDGHVSAVPFTVVPVHLTARTGSSAALRTAVPSLRRSLRRAGLAEVDYLLIDQPLFVGLNELVRARKTVYRPTDVYRSATLAAAQAHVVAGADAVVATSSAVLESLPERGRRVPHMVLTNGVDLRRFDLPTGHVDSTERDAAVYVGALDDRVDWRWLERVAEAVPDVRIDLYGPLPRSLPPHGANVRFRGPVAYEELPRVLSRYVVGLLPFAGSEENSGRSPMKLYEYLASGLHVVATPHFAQSASPDPGVHVAESPAAAGAVLARILRDPERNRAGVEAAARHGWAGKARELLAFLERL